MKFQKEIDWPCFPAHLIPYTATAVTIRCCLNSVHLRDRIGQDLGAGERGGRPRALGGLPACVWSLCVCPCLQGHHHHPPLKERQLWRELTGGPHLAGGGGGCAGHQEVSGHGVHVRDSLVHTPVTPGSPLATHLEDPVTNLRTHSAAPSCSEQLEGPAS